MIRGARERGRDAALRGRVVGGSHGRRRGRPSIAVWANTGRDAGGAVGARHDDGGGSPDPGRGSPGRRAARHRRPVVGDDGALPGARDHAPALHGAGLRAGGRLRVAVLHRRGWRRRRPAPRRPRERPGPHPRRGARARWRHRRPRHPPQRAGARPVGLGSDRRGPRRPGARRPRRHHHLHAGQHRHAELGLPHRPSRADAGAAGVRRDGAGQLAGVARGWRRWRSVGM